MVLHGTAWLLGGRFARTAVTLIGVAVLARLLTPADFGVVAVAAMILPLGVALLDGLIDVPVIREDDLDRAGLSNLIWSAVVVMAGLGALIWTAAPWLAQILNSPRLSEVLRVLCFGLLLQPFVSAGYALLRRRHRFAAVGSFLLISGSVYVFFAIGLALLGAGVWSLILGQLTSLLTVAVGVSVTAGVPVLPPRRLQPGAAWRFGGLGFATRLLAWLWANMDTLFASSALGAVGAGFYSRAYNITTQLKEPFAALDQTVRQAFVAQKSLDDEAASRATLGGLRLVVLVAALVAASIIVLREAVVTLLLGEQWGPVVVPLAVLAASLPARIARMYLDSFTYARGSMRQMLGRNLAIVAMMTGGLWLWAQEGVVAISLVVAGIHFLTLLFPGGSVDRAVAGTLVQRLAAITPGYVIGAVFVVAAESICAFAGLWIGILDWGIRAVFCAVAFLLVPMLVPERWLPRSVAALRWRLVTFDGTN